MSFVCIATARTAGLTTALTLRRTSLLLKNLSHLQSRSMANKVTFPSDNPKGECHGVVNGDSSLSKKGLIVIHEWWGMNEQIQEEGAMISRDGQFVVLVPDLYRGKVATDHETAGHYMGDLDWKGAVSDIQGAARYLLKQGCSKVGVTGFCMGGALTFAAAALVPELSAAAPFYGIPSPQLADITTIKIPVQAHFGELDDIKGFSSPEDYTKMKAGLEKAGVSLDFHTYKAGHGFTNQNNPNYNADICNEALKRMQQFMNEKLA